MLVLAADVYEAVLEHAREDAPLEACGVLAGERDPESGVARAVSVHRAHNAADAPRVAYEIDPADLLHLIESIEEAGREVVGFYHSHPAGPPHLSDRDRREATWEGYHYLLVSLAGSTAICDAWRWTGEEFVRDDVAVRD
ncbi:desampylase [Halospeciosus flavus]|uniref:Desampylase n=1 Tax=Halospeciosus flavus TaxID=3032283 RepID=A0ABD5Z9F5_9EURY|nr:desampylase [Halospeciosus flavus]